MNRMRRFTHCSYVLIFVTAFFLVGCEENKPTVSSSSAEPEKKLEKKFKMVPVPVDAVYDTVSPDAAYAVLREAEAGDANAQYRLGWMYEAGDGVPKDAAKAMEWWQKAAVQGDADAQYKLGLMYADGDGVPKDAVKAVAWYQKAAAQGYAGAQHNLGVMYDNGRGVPKDAAKAVEWYQKAAAQGHADAQGNLGVMYGNGTGIRKDSVLGYAWTNLAAASSGNEMTIKNRAIQERALSARDLAEAQRISSAWKPGRLLVRENSPTKTGATPAKTSGTLTKRGTGTTFVVNTTGHAITNEHVVRGCTELRIGGQIGSATLVTEDAANDLALLKIHGAIKAATTITSDPSKLRQGEDVVVFGFPLNSVLSSGGNLTLGVVSAVTGLGNNTNQIQITAPIQPGSSGSPVLNKKGEVVGVVSMKLSDSKMVQVTGSVGQNVNFAVSGLTLRTFLDTHKVRYSSGGLRSIEKNAADLADEARKWTMVVECWR